MSAREELEAWAREEYTLDLPEGFHTLLDTLCAEERAKGRAEGIAEWMNGDAELTRLRAIEAKVKEALREVERHHVEQNAIKGRDESRSHTLRVVRDALAAVETREVRDA